MRCNYTDTSDHKTTDELFSENLMEGNIFFGTVSLDFGGLANSRLGTTQ